MESHGEWAPGQEPCEAEALSRLGVCPGDTTISGGRRISAPGTGARTADGRARPGLRQEGLRPAVYPPVRGRGPALPTTQQLCPHYIGRERRQRPYDVTNQFY